MGAYATLTKLDDWLLGECDGAIEVISWSTIVGSSFIISKVDPSRAGKIFDRQRIEYKSACCFTRILEPIVFDGETERGVREFASLISRDETIITANIPRLHRSAELVEEYSYWFIDKRGDQRSADSTMFFAGTGRSGQFAKLFLIRSSSFLSFNFCIALSSDIEYEPIT